MIYHLDYITDQKGVVCGYIHPPNKPYYSKGWFLNPHHSRGYIWIYLSTKWILPLFYGTDWCIYVMVTCLWIIKCLQLRSTFNIQFFACTHNHNGSVESLIKRLQVITITLLFQYKLPISIWDILYYMLMHSSMTHYLSSVLTITTCNWSLNCSHFKDIWLCSISPHFISIMI